VNNTEHPSGNCTAKYGTCDTTIYSTQRVAKYGTCGTAIQPCLIYYKVRNVWHNHILLPNVLQIMECMAQSNTPT